jgi:excisionase family DNA binding protein
MKEMYLVVKNDEVLYEGSDVMTILDVASNNNEGVEIRRYKSVDDSISIDHFFYSNGGLVLNENESHTIDNFGKKALESILQPSRKIENPFLTIQAFADISKIHVQTAYDLVKSNELAALKVGRSIRISSQNLAKYLGIELEEVDKIYGHDAQEILLEVKDVAEIVGLHYQTMIKIIDDEIPSLMFGSRARRIPSGSLADYLKTSNEDVIELYNKNKKLSE